jgi:hypothetical protein
MQQARETTGGIEDVHGDIMRGVEVLGEIDPKALYFQINLLINSSFLNQQELITPDDFSPKSIRSWNDFFRVNSFVFKRIATTNSLALVQLRSICEGLGIEHGFPDSAVVGIQESFRGNAKETLIVSWRAENYNVVQSILPQIITLVLESMRNSKVRRRVISSGDLNALISLHAHKDQYAVMGRNYLDFPEGVDLSTLFVNTIQINGCIVNPLNGGSIEILNTLPPKKRRM